MSLKETSVVININYPNKICIQCYEEIIFICLYFQLFLFFKFETNALDNDFFLCHTQRERSRIHNG